MDNNHNLSIMWGEHSIMADKTFELTSDEIRIMGLVLISLVSLIHITITSLYVVIPVISVLILGLLIKNIKDLRK